MKTTKFVIQNYYFELCVIATFLDGGCRTCISFAYHQSISCRDVSFFTAATPPPPTPQVIWEVSMSYKLISVAREKNS